MVIVICTIDGDRWFYGPFDSRDDAWGWMEENRSEWHTFEVHEMFEPDWAGKPKKYTNCTRCGHIDLVE